MTALRDWEGHATGALQLLYNILQLQVLQRTEKSNWPPPVIEWDNPSTSESDGEAAEP